MVFLQAYDPLQPLNSINTYEAPDRQSTALDDPSALRYSLDNFQYYCV